LPAATLLRLTVRVAHVSAPPVEVRSAVAMIGPVIESWRMSMPAIGDPAVRRAAPSAYRMATVLIWNRLNGPFSCSQSVLARLLRGTRTVKTPVSLFVAAVARQRLHTRL